MALSDLVIYDETLYSWRVELLNENINLFNSQSAGGITLGQGNNIGDYSTKTFIPRIQTVRRRNAHSEAAIAKVKLGMEEETSVKVAAGTFEFEYVKGDLQWIGANQQALAIAHAKMMSEDIFKDMLNVGINAFIAATAGQASLYTDKSAAVDGTQYVTWPNLLTMVAKLGDAGSRIKCWVMHSKTALDLLAQNYANSTSLFSYGTVNILRDIQGRPIIISDAVPFVAGTPNDYYTLGLTEGAIVIEENGDWASNEVSKNGFEQIITSYQAQWSYQLGLKGYSWDRANGGPSPTNAALFTGSNWDKVYASDKDMAGVLLRTQ